MHGREGYDDLWVVKSEQRRCRKRGRGLEARVGGGISPKKSECVSSGGVVCDGATEEGVGQEEPGMRE